MENIYLNRFARPNRMGNFSILLLQNRLYYWRITTLSISVSYYSFCAVLLLLHVFLSTVRALWLMTRVWLVRVPGNYSVVAGYCTTRHYPDLTGYLNYGQIRVICHNFWDSHINYTSCGETQSGHLPCDRLWCKTLLHHAWPIIAHLVLHEAGQMTVYWGTV